MTTKKNKETEVEIQFTRPLTAKEKKHNALFRQVLKYFDENGGAYAYHDLKLR